MEPLPPKEHILEACRALPPSDHPVLASAHLLAGLHRQRLYADFDITIELDRHRARLIMAIDRYLADELPPPRGEAHLHTETVGMVVDRIAQYSVKAHETLRSDPEWVVHDAWHRLAELALGYEDLVYEVSAGLRRLPALDDPDAS